VRVLHKIGVCVALVTVIEIVLSVIFFPAGRTLSEEQVKQRHSNRLLKMFSEEILTNGCRFADIDSDSELLPVKACTNLMSFLITIYPHQTIRISGLSVPSDPQAHANIESRLAAHEKFGLWSDSTASVYFDALGTCRMKEADLKEILAGQKKVLKYDNKKQFWMSTEE